jgi:hypothetical protein
VEAPSAWTGGEPKDYIHLKYFCIFVQNRLDMKMKYQSMGGLRVEKGRLINDRPNGVSGIEQAAMLRKAMRRAKKVDMYADGIDLAEGRKNFYRM